MVDPYPPQGVASVAKHDRPAFGAAAGPEGDTMNLRTLPIFLAFFAMGFADAVGPLAGTLKSDPAFALSGFMVGLLPAFTFIAFALLSVPGGVLAARIGKKKLLILAFSLNAVGVLIPSLIVPSYALLLGALFLLGAGTTLLQVAGNPIMRDVSPEGQYASNLAFAQFIKGIGSVGSTYVVGALAAAGATAAALVTTGATGGGILTSYAGKMGWRSIFPVFLVLTAVSLVALLALRIHETKAEEPPSIAGSLALLKEPAFGLAVFGIFLYVGAEVGLTTWLAPRLEDLGFSKDRAGMFGPTLVLGSLTFGRLVGSVILRRLSPQRFFVRSAGLGVLGILGLMSGHAHLAVAGVVFCGLGFANIWPLLFSITVEARPQRSAELSGLMCMAIFGGAVLPPVMGALVDGAGYSVAFGVPLVAFLYLFGLALAGNRKAQPAQAS
jgi:FHS family L-fucose permease-like MFS transporter